MDFISHLFIGSIWGKLASKRYDSGNTYAVPVKKQSILMNDTVKKRLPWGIVIMSVAADLLHLPIYFFLGNMMHRPFWLPKNADWNGFALNYPEANFLWFILHSMLWLVFIVVPVCIVLKLGLESAAAYGLHIFIDIFSHTGEFSVQPFYPLSHFAISGFSDAWRWGFGNWALCWIVLATVFFMLFKRRKNAA